MNPLLSPLLRWFGKLSYPRLLLVAAGLFLVDLLVPDVIPLVDEILLGLGTLVLANWKKRKDPAAGSQRDPIEGDPPRR